MIKISKFIESLKVTWLRRPYDNLMIMGCFMNVCGTAFPMLILENLFLEMVMPNFVLQI